MGTQKLNVSEETMMKCLVLFLLVQTAQFSLGKPHLDNNSRDLIAQGTCQGLAEHSSGWMYAVKRYDPGVDCAQPELTCTKICQDESLRTQRVQLHAVRNQDEELVQQNATGMCKAGMSVSRHYHGNLLELGTKGYMYLDSDSGCSFGGTGQKGQDCGPNYCCCQFVAAPSK